MTDEQDESEEEDVLVPADDVLSRIEERQERLFGGDEDLLSDKSDENDEIDGFIEVEEQIRIEKEFQEDIDGLIPVDEQISTIRRNHEEYMAEPDFKLGDKFVDDHTGQILVVKHRMQNYDDPTDFIYALSIDDEDIPNYQWHGEDWIHSHYERISDEEAGDEE